MCLDPWLGAYKVDAVDWTKAPLTHPNIRALLLSMRSLMLRDKELNTLGDNRLIAAYSVDHLAWFVTKEYERVSGKTLTEVEQRRLEPLVREVVEELTHEGLMEEVKPGWWLGAAGPDDLPTYEELLVPRGAEEIITWGDGPQSVYAWYLPNDKELAELKGERTYAMKVGRTTRHPQGRMRRYASTRPKLGFHYRTHDATNWEKLLHAYFHIQGRHLPEGDGREWFRTSPEELETIVRRIECIGKEAKDKS